MRTLIKSLTIPSMLVLGVGLLLASTGQGGAKAGQPTPPATGSPVSSLMSFDRLMLDLLKRWNLPGGALAVAKDGRLVLARGYGYADKESQEPVQPESLFRIASISKPITAAAVLKLWEEGRLDLDAKAFCRPGAPQTGCILTLVPPPNTRVDGRVYSVTVRQLLHHAGGWDRERSFDPMFMPYTKLAAQALGQQPPASCETIIRYMLGQRLDFTPGTRYAYSNFGYCVLGEIVEAVTGQSYEAFVREAVLAPAGISRMHLGHTLLKDRTEGEVKYYDYPGAPLVESVFPGEGRVPFPYGGFYLEAMAAHGDWIASAIDLVRFVTVLDGRRQVPKPPLKPETVRLMISRPAPPLWVRTAYYYAMGWLVRPVSGGEANWWHDGSLPGTSSLLVRTYHGLTWAALFNSRPAYPRWLQLMQELDDGLWRAAGQVTSWPPHDLFEQYP